MNIEQIAIGIKDANGLDMSDEAAITFLRRCLSKLVDQDVEPVAYMYQDQTGPLTGKCFVGGAQTGDTSLYTETQLLAAQQRTAEACAKVCEATADKYQETESRLWPECRSDAQSGASSCEGSIRNGEWRKYL